jgi:hypothetical protein
MYSRPIYMIQLELGLGSDRFFIHGEVLRWQNQKIVETLLEIRNGLIEFVGGCNKLTFS